MRLGQHRFFSLVICGFISLLSVGSYAKTYTVDLDQNYSWLCDTLETQKWLETDSFPAGTYTIKTKSSSSTHVGWADLVVLNLVNGISGTCSDYAWMTLNGIGDSIIIPFDTWGRIRAGVIDGYPGDNGGDIEIEIRGTNGSDYPDSIVINTTVEDAPYGIAVLPNGEYVYVANHSSGNVSVIRTSDNTVVDTIPLGGQLPRGITALPNGNYVYVANQHTNNVSVIRTSDNTVVDTIPVGDAPAHVISLPNGNYVYVTNQHGSSVSVIRTSDNTVVETISIGNEPYDIIIVPSGDYIYVTHQLTNIVSVIRTSDNMVVETISAGDYPSGAACLPNGSYIYVTNYNANDVSVIRTSDNTIVDTIPVGTEPYDAAVLPNGEYVYIANRGSNNISVIRTSDNAVVETIPMGDPNRIAILPNGEYVYITNITNDDVSVLGFRGITKTYTVDLDQNYSWLCDTLGTQKWMETDSFNVGEYRGVRLTNSTSSRLGWGDLVVLNLVNGISGTCSDYAWMTLNGVGDSIIIPFDTWGRIRAGVIDGYPGDNGGDIEIELIPYQTIEEQNNRSNLLDVEFVQNPLCSGNNIYFSIPNNGGFSLSLYDLTGRKLKIIEEGVKTTGKYGAKLDIEDISSGIYFIRLQTGYGNKTRKITVIR